MTAYFIIDGILEKGLENSYQYDWVRDPFTAFSSEEKKHNLWLHIESFTSQTLSDFMAQCGKPVSGAMLCWCCTEDELQVPAEHWTGTESSVSCFEKLCTANILIDPDFLILILKKVIEWKKKAKYELIIFQYQMLQKLTQI